MKFSETYLKGLYVIDIEPFVDERGQFFRTFCKNEFTKIGHKKEFVQTNNSFSAKKGTFRGLHYQIPPHSEVKLVRCISGSLIDVVVDVRKNSKTFLKSFRIELSVKNRKMIYVPEGFAHGYFTLVDNTVLSYMVTTFYHPKSEKCLNVKDPVLGIQLPNKIESLSDKDINSSFLTESFKGI